jgi:hypothetical protein
VLFLLAEELRVDGELLGSLGVRGPQPTAATPRAPERSRILFKLRIFVLLKLR